MNLLRALLFTLWLYGAMAIIGIAGLPLMVTRRSAMWVVKAWAHTALFGLRWIMGVKVVVRGREHAPQPGQPVLLAAKHQSMMDIIWPFTVFDSACFVLKKELMMAPVLGWYAWRCHMIPVDRSAAAAALKKMVADVRERLGEGQQIVIYPEGTRTQPGADPAYKPGVAGIYRDLGDVPVTLVATNSGTCWPAKGLGFRPGTVVFEYLEPIPAGLKRGQFMELLQSRIETASKALL